MWALLAGLLTTAVAIAISPLAIVTVILFATKGSGRTKGTAFLLGYILLEVLLVGAIVLWGREAGAEVEGSETNVTIDVVQILLGALLLVMAVGQWLRRTSEHEPKWLGKLDGVKLWQAFGLGFLLAGPLSPKDLPLLISAAGRISQADITPEETVVVIAIFTALTAVAVAIPWFVSVFTPTRTEQLLSGMRRWLIANHAVIMTLLFLILGVKLIGTGAADLLV